MFLVQNEMFLMQGEIFLVEYEMFLVEDEMFPVQDEMFLVQDEMFPVEDEMFLVCFLLSRSEVYSPPNLLFHTDQSYTLSIIYIIQYYFPYIWKIVSKSVKKDLFHTVLVKYH